ncbi:EutP/PduV family microcompartment system protein [Inediibacterium massiliense]|uniref:EutP/PduV family microcompartment system protein n=1 Tax=Inediibacterium massiliense TaxID=1658111 RepID=UPI0006B4DD63|nr:EutP/PduV family microcompartment system protein [Inediibacterium massiliense]
MKKIMLVGKSGSGKTTLMQVLNHYDIEYQKTQTIEYEKNILDTPGEYIENVRFYNALITSSYDCDIIGFINDCTDVECIFPPKFACIFTKPVIGIITKIDENHKNVIRAEECLVQAGVKEIFPVSALHNKGIEALKKILGCI